jgi:hypothetical protein
MSSVRVVAADEQIIDERPAPGSALARIKRAAAQQRGQRHVELVVGGAFGEHLVVRYGVLPIDEMDRYVDLANPGASMRLSQLTLDLMVSAARTVLWVEGDDVTDLGVRLDSSLWQLLDWPLPDGVALDELTPREIVLALFGDNGLAVLAHAEELMGWMRDPGGDSPGEALAATS